MNKLLLDSPVVRSLINDYNNQVEALGEDKDSMQQYLFLYSLVCQARIAEELTYISETLNKFLELQAGENEPE